VKKTTKAKVTKKSQNMMTKEEEYNFTLVLLSFISVTIISLCLYCIYTQNQKIELTEKCSELMQYRNDVKLDTTWSWSCDVKDKAVEEKILDQIINYYKASAVVMESAE
jgi:hypothetical protein